MKYFDYSEFDSPDQIGSGEEMMNQAFLDKLDEAREIAGTSFLITSGYRTVEHNRVVKGSVTSSHLTGVACDIGCVSGSARLRIISALMTVGFTRIGIAHNFIHVDLDVNKPDSIWVY